MENLERRTSPSVTPPPPIGARSPGGVALGQPPAVAEAALFNEMAAQHLDARGVPAVPGGSDARDGDGTPDAPEFDFHAKGGEYGKGRIPSRFENHNNWRCRLPILYILRP